MDKNLITKRDNLYLFVGEVIKPHGLKGGLSIQNWRSGPPPDVARIVLKHPKRGRIIKFTVKKWSLRPKNGWVLFTNEITSRGKSELYRGYEVGIYREDLPALKENEFYLEDLIDCELKTPQEVIGIITGIVPNPVPYPLLLVETKDGIEKLIPLPEEKILSLNFEQLQVIIEHFTDFEELE